jgi:uncharacterized protein DUF4331
MRKTTAALPALAAAALLAAGCEERLRTITEIETDTVVVTDTIRIGNTGVVFDQVERLANPLVSEVMVEKREHGHYNTSDPRDDRALFRDDLVRFITGVAGRDAAYAGAVADALLPDKLLVRTDRTGGGPFGASVGWLTYVLDPANGYGGRKLTGDDAVDKGLAVLFGNALGNNAGVSPGLVTDNVDANDRTHSATFPYLAAPN